MIILTIHADYFSFKPTIKTKIAEDTEPVERECSNCLVVFIAVEPGDRKKISRAIEEIKKVRETIKVNRIILYPYAHLSSNLARPKEALEVLKDLEKELERIFEVVIRAPFGWYKAFKLHAKGHPLAELSRRI